MSCPLILSAPRLPPLKQAAALSKTLEFHKDRAESPYCGGLAIVT
ncbi:hypothetical protein BN1221_00567 [Brenneria goodwinii]|uniref:Uncharacterized protein n=1 Tax=Brenneria goodwinii TaxID=1109412 RepID=A0A0G4JQH0_9GAMM|nr:hypothetical protein BN1221_00567 [Brenneria goodwinii]